MRRVNCRTSAKADFLGENAHYHHPGVVLLDLPRSNIKLPSRKGVNLPYGRPATCPRIGCSAAKAFQVRWIHNEQWRRALSRHVTLDGPGNLSINRKKQSTGRRTSKQGKKLGAWETCGSAPGHFLDLALIRGSEPAPVGSIQVRRGMPHAPGVLVFGFGVLGSCNLVSRIPDHTE